MYNEVPGDNPLPDLPPGGKEYNIPLRRDKKGGLI
jgi:hypothetical protein